MSEPGVQNATLDLLAMIPIFAPIKGAEGAIVIGENMAGRVIPFAEKAGASWYKAQSWANPANWMKNNTAWLQKQMKAGRTIIDIGPDAARKPSKDRVLSTRWNNR